ncbi:MAG: hypothetical protein J2P46_00370 [Zavarzinella sp.]|nr:hypothetical protein [Zavarzinella sp.]
MNDYGTGGAPAPDFNDRDEWFRSARHRVRAPGLMLQIVGVLAVGVGTMLGVATVVNPEGLVRALYEQHEENQKKVPPAQRQKLPPQDETVNSLRIEGPIYGILLLGAGIVMFIGGMKMRDLKGYGWGVAGSILAMFPGLCCCCLPVPFGIWALVVLLNSDVKLAFSRSAQMTQDREVPRDDWDSRADRPRDDDLR